MREQVDFYLKVSVDVDANSTKADLKDLSQELTEILMWEMPEVTKVKVNKIKEEAEIYGNV